MKTFGSKHVPELDGLRGIAILAVVIHHQLTPFSLSGGFLGVDLFFVLSGFLITSLLLGEFKKTATISFKNFYMRRLLRLGPALALYLLASLLVAYRTQAIEISRQVKLIAMAVFYSTNWRMAFGWDSTLDPTAIIWSLSIEEQFYLVWPLVLAGCLALKLTKRVIAVGLGVIVIGILVNRYLLLEAGSDLTRLYYGTDTRADALLVGCLFGLLHAKSVDFRAGMWLKVSALCSTAALAILLFTAEFSDTFFYQGGFTLVALLSGVLTFVSANGPPRFLSLALRLTPLVWFGKISYGLYLWHWLVVRNTSFYSLGPWESSAKLALAVGIAATSFYFIEKPFNQLKTRFAPRPDGPRISSTTVIADGTTVHHDRLVGA